MMAMCYRFLLWCCCNEECDGNLLPAPSSLVVLKRIWQWQLAIVALFSVLKKKKTMVMHRHLFCGGVVMKKVMAICYHRLLLWWC